MTAVGFTTANDEPDRDPTKLRLFGSATSFDDLVEIGSELSVTPPAGRQEDYTDVAVNNTTAYQYYRIVFSEISDAAATNSMQVAEIRLSGYTDAGFPRFTPGEPATGFTSAVTIYDENTQTITATISANLEDGDILGCPDCAANNITATWTSPNLVLTANGSPTQANWQTAIQSLTFLRAVGGSTSAPSITLTVSDGTLEGSAVLDIPIIERTLTVTAPSSTLTNGASLELSSSVSHGSGAVTYSTTGPCSVDGTTVTATGPTGQCVITALIAADSGYSEVTSPDLALTILAIQPDISMSDPTIFGAVDQPIGNIAPANTGDDATWSVTPALPVGLVLDTATGVISGTPTNSSAATTYTLTATNSGGSDTVSFDLSIVNAPDAPTDLAATAGNASATISFTAGGNGGSDIVNYQFSIDDGTTWTALDPADSESPITITGLTNGTEQTIVLRAVSEAGTGATSDPVTVTPTAPTTTTAQPTTTTAQPTTTTAQPTTTTSILPVRDNAGTLPQVNASTAGIIINADGEAIVATPTLEGDSVVLSDGDTVFRLAGTLSDGNAATAQSNGRLVIDSGGSVRTSGAGFSPGSTVHVWVMSDPIYLGPVTVNADGTFDATLQLPSELPAGDHTIQANGTLADDSTRSMNLGISVLPLGELPATGANPNVAVIVLALALGVFLTISARRRSI
ncbi:MAG: putative Ig domain-containing protein [Ilumatobacteraceae bacterium]